MVNNYILREIIIKINEVHETIRKAMEVINDDETRKKLEEIYDDMGMYAERIVSVLGGNGNASHSIEVDEVHSEVV